MALQKIGTHAKLTKPPKYWRPQRQSTEPETRSPLEVLQGNPRERSRRLAITKLGSIDHGFIEWWLDRAPTQTRRATANHERPSTFEEYHERGKRLKLTRSSNMSQTDERWNTWATESDPQWLEVLVSHLGFCSVV